MSSEEDKATLKTWYEFMTEGNEGRNRYRVAHFQRPYVWPERFVWHLIDDLWELYRNGSMLDPKDQPTKLMGCVITHASGDCIHQIVDGQQRLISLTLIHRAVVYWCRKHCGKLPYRLKKLFASEEPNLTFRAMDTTTNSDGTPTWHNRLMLFDYDEMDWFHKVFFADPEAASDKLIDDLLEDQNVPQQRLPFVNNFKTILTFLADRKGPEQVCGGLTTNCNILALKTEDFQNKVRGGEGSDPGYYMLHMKDVVDLPPETSKDLDDFVHYISSHIKIIHFITFKAEMALSVFNALNRPGWPLSDQQRLKASLLVNIPYSTVDMVSSIWNEAERQMMALTGWDSEPLAPFFRCLLEITPKPTTSTIQDYFFTTPDCPGKFRQSHRLGLVDEFQDFCVEVHEEVPPARATKRLRLYESDGKPNQKAVQVFIENYMDSLKLIPMYISLVNLGDPCSWGEGHFLTALAFSPDMRAEVQNAISCLKHLHHLNLDHDWIYPAMLAARLWGLGDDSTTPKVEPQTVVDFFVQLEVFAAYLVFCRPQSPRDSKKYAKTLWELEDEDTREERMAIYRELLQCIYTKSPEDVVTWLQFDTLEKIKFKMLLHPKEDKLFGTDASWLSDAKGKLSQVIHSRVKHDLKVKVLTYMLLKAEMQLCNSSRDAMESFDAISQGLLQESGSASVNGYRQLTLRPIVPKYLTFSDWTAFGTQNLLMFPRDNLWLGNLTLTLQNIEGDPSAFERHSFESFASSTVQTQNLHGFFSTTRLLSLSTSPRVFTHADMEWRHHFLMQLVNKSWGLLSGELEALPPPTPEDLTAGIWSRQLDLLSEVDDVPGEENELDRIINTGSPQLSIGMLVSISGLKSASALNDKKGIIEKFDEASERYHVRIDGEAAPEGTKSFKSTNLTPLNQTELQDIPMLVPDNPKVKTALCNALNGGGSCANIGKGCNFAHTPDEWRCFQFAMRKCVDGCTGLVKSCPTPWSKKRRKQHKIKFEDHSAKRRKVEVLLPSMPKAAAPAWAPRVVAPTWTPKPTFAASGPCPWGNSAWSSPSLPLQPVVIGGRRLQGIVTSIQPWEGCGYITFTDPGCSKQKIWFSFSMLVPLWSFVRLNDYVDFFVGNSSEGRYAKSVRRLTW